MKVRDSGMPEEAIWSSFFDVERILTALQINGGVGDLMEIGCGYGTFTIPAAKTISGKVHAFDIEAEMIEIVRNKSSIEKITNIEFYYLDLLVDGSGLTSGSMEYVMLFNILHHNRPLELLSESFRVLKPGGKTGIIHWRSDIATPRGPDLSIRPTPEHCSDWAIESGFKIIKQAEIISPYHFGIVIQKP